MKVVYTHRTQGVGAEGAHVLGMVQAFRGLGHQVEVDCLPGCDPSAIVPDGLRPGEQPVPPKPQSPSLLKRLYWLVAEKAPPWAFALVELGYNPLLFFRLWRVCRRTRPDFLYERYALNTFAPTWVASILGIPHVLEVNDAVVIERSRRLALAGLARRVERHCLRRCRLVITITARFRDLLAHAHGLNPASVLVLPNAIDGDRFVEAPPRAPARERWELGSGPVLGGSGQFLPWHGLKELVTRTGPEAEARDWRYLFIGDGPARAEVEAEAARLGIAHRCRFTGMRPIAEVPAHLAALDLAVVPSAAPHASPMKLMEYMACGLPVVAPDIPAIRDALPAACGYLFAEGDFAAMKARIDEALADPDEARRRGAAARDHALRHLTWKSHATVLLHRLGNPR